MLRTRRVLLFAALVLQYLATPAFASSCKEDGGTNECRDLIQLETRYGDSSFDNCNGHAPASAPYHPACVFSSNDAMLQFTKQELMCPPREFCEEPVVVSQGTYVPNTGLQGFDPEFQRTEADPDSTFGSEGIKWRYRLRQFGVCDAAPRDDWTDGLKCAPLVCPPGFPQREVISIIPRAEICVRSTFECCHGGLGGGHSFGNPILVPELEKQQTEQDADLSAEFLIALRRNYSNNGDVRPVGTHDIAPPKPVAQYVRSILGGGWRFEFETYASASSGLSTATTTVRFVRPNGLVRYFRLVGNALVGDGDETGVASQVLSGSTVVGYQYQTSSDRLETYAIDGRLQSLSLHGKTNHFTYDSAGRLTEIEGYAGRKILFFYAGASPSVSTITLPDGATIDYTYNEHGNITSVTYPTNQVRRYEYQSNYQPFKLARIIDEDNSTFATYGYNAYDQAVSTEHAGGVNRYAITDLGGMRFRIQGPLGDLHEQTYQLVAGKYRQTDLTAKCPSCGPFRKRFPDAVTGLVTRTVDFREGVTDFQYGTRGLETLRREGEVNLSTAQCPSGSSYFPGNYGSLCTTGTCWGPQPFPGSVSAAPLGYPSQQYRCNSTDSLRTTSTIWHSDFHQPTERKIQNAQNQTESLVRWTYNARGQATAKCEIDPTDASAVGYACSATSSPPAGAKVRRWVYTYCETADIATPGSTCPILGLKKSINGPRSASDDGMGGFDDLVAFSYYPNTDESGCGIESGACHRKGDLWKMTNALGKAVETVAYDKNGRVVRSKDLNGTITDLIYHPRGWLLERTVRANANGNPSVDDAITEFEYTPTGNVKRVTQPDGTSLKYTYDAAHRLTDVVDNLKNRLHYTLDAAGNRIKEESYNASYSAGTPGAGLKRAMSRTYNELSRLTQTRDASFALTRDSTPFDGTGLADGYDANGNAVQSADGLGIETKRTYDPLNRLSETIQDYLGPDLATANTITEYTYDARNNLRKVTDPDQLPTTYTYDGLNNLTALDSPDTGHTDYTYDKAGNRISQTDYRGVLSTYTYDALNRLIGIAYPTASTDVTFAYDEPDVATGCNASYPLDKLTSMTDASGSTTYCYDRHGNVTSKTQVTLGKTLVVSYAYNKADRLMSLTYPSGAIVSYTRDSVGRVTGVSWQANATATPIAVINSATYLPFGPLNVLTYANGRTLTSTYDANYVIDSVVSSATDGLKLDFTTDVMSNITAASETPGVATPTRQYRYDRLYRLTRVDDASNVMQEYYAYSKTGDRTLKQFAGQAAQVYTYLAGTHHLDSVDGASRSYDANGNTTDRGDGTALEYDERNRLTQVGSGLANYYSHNGKGERVTNVHGSATQGSTLKRYSYNEAGLLLSAITYSNLGKVIATIEYLYLDTAPVAQVTNGVLTYLEPDHLETPRIAADRTTNAQLWNWDFFGSAFGEHEASGTIEVNLRYPGQVFDWETGLHYNYFRDYEPSTGRYIESDPIGLKAGINTYSYVQARPFSWVDRYGLSGSHPSAVVCDGNGGFEIVNNDQTCTRVCTQQHEWSHLDDLKSWAPNICRKLAAGDNPGPAVDLDAKHSLLPWPRPNSENPVRVSECKAHQVSLDCARRLRCCNTEKYIEIDETYINNNQCYAIRNL